MKFYQPYFQETKEKFIDLFPNNDYTVHKGIYSMENKEKKIKEEVVKKSFVPTTDLAKRAQKLLPKYDNLMKRLKDV